ncbi:tail fiber assembly protein [Xenorhabdus sp. IM139775]|uniref:tail fiber assembly protein n=1 Tax=Xenorhabdus sp. IM139775 TaxID=3025876 RepID=UPI00235953DC|nr:tail fiber assembly protein [Xenorhabdus sp. IM139775]MDC9593493.1 tail fiber assembly protein [Xenorhabdus sp. IM139775]
MMYTYSAKNNMFYLLSIKQNYINAGTWPDDGIEVVESVFLEFAADRPPQGKRRIAGADGLPAWANIPPPTSGELQQQAERKKRHLLDAADTQIMRLTRITRRKMATDDEINLLNNWELYSIELTRLNCAAPDIQWPEQPK